MNAIFPLMGIHDKGKVFRLCYIYAILTRQLSHIFLSENNEVADGHDIDLIG